MSASTSPQSNPAPQPTPVGNTQTNPGASQTQPLGGQPGAANPQNPVQQPDGEVQKLLQALQQEAAALGASEGGLRARIGALNLAASAPGQLQQQSFRTEVAYALQDLERAIGKPFLPAGPLATEMNQLATTMHGLGVGRMRDILVDTPKIADQALVNDIRQTAQSIVRLGQHQQTPDVEGLVDVLYNRLRLSSAPQVNGAAPVGTIAQTGAAAQAQAQSSGAAATTAQAARPGQNTSPAARQQPRQTASMDITRRLRAPVPNGAEVTYPLPSASIVSRISIFEERLAQGKTLRLLGDAEKSGVRAIEATEQFIQGPGRGVLGKMEAAAGTEPGGMQTVLREMQPGGRYANLRTEFDNAYQQDQIFRGAYDKMVDNVTRFGRDRDAVTNNFTQRNLDPAQLDGRFQRAEESLGEAMSKIPGKQSGKSALDEVAEKLAEVLRAAVDRIKHIFQPAAAQAQQQARPGPSMSP
jgi:hypothetical protein